MRRMLTWGTAGGAVVLLIAFAAWPRALPVEMARCVRGEIRVNITEEAETRLDQEYVVTMPVGGRLLRTDLQEGQVVEKGGVVARIDTFERLEKLKTLRARLREVEAMIVGVDSTKPKPEQVRAAQIRAEEAGTYLALVQKELESARINFLQEEKQYKRSKELLDENVITESKYDEALRLYGIRKVEYEQADLKVEVARKALAWAEQEAARVLSSVDDNEYMRSVHQAQMEQIRAAMAVLEDELAKSQIASPVTGPVLEEYQEDEQVLPAGTPLLKIGDLDSIRIESDILSEEIGRVEVGREVAIYGPAVGPAPAAGKVERIYPAGFEKISSLGIEQQRVKVIIAFDNAELRLQPGVRVDVRIITDRKTDALLIPERALFKALGRWCTFVVRGGRARFTPVEVGLRTDELAEIIEPLREGDTVILSPPTELSEGDRVAPEAAP